MSNYDETRRQCEMALRELSRVEKALRDTVEQVATVRRYVQEASDRAQAILETRSAREPCPSGCTANCEHHPAATLAPAQTKWTGNVRVAALPPATEPQECWAVGPTFAPAGHWLCVRVYRDGTHNQYGVPRKTREEAEADGLASGLPRWHEAVPAALPTDVTVPQRKP